jgi:hypothetical protein
MATDSTPAFDAASLTKLVPGFDFLQSLAKGAGSAMPGLSGFGQWVAPTLDPKELEKKISELRTVQFWLEQNATLLKTTIQALEVQKMTLSTLASMKVPLDGLRESLQAAAPSTAGKGASASAPKGSPLVDPMQWWNALAGQFSELAAQSLKGNAAGAAQAMAGSMVDDAVGRMAETAARAMPRKRGAVAGAETAGSDGPESASTPTRPAARKRAAKRPRRTGG